MFSAARLGHPFGVASPQPIPYQRRTLLLGGRPSRMCCRKAGKPEDTPPLGPKSGYNRLGPPSSGTHSEPLLGIGSGGNHAYFSRANEDEAGSLERAYVSLKERASEAVGRALYKYYNWRQDTLSDLQLFVLLNAVILVLGAAVRRHIAALDAAAVPAAEAALDPSASSWWNDLYEVLVVVLGQQLPEEQAGFAYQAFAVTTAVLGVASFALVLALVEQVALEVLEGNVRKGGTVYEIGHYVVCAAGESARDLAQVATVLTQLCAASKRRGGTAIAVLVAQREKLELEALFKETVPVERRHGSQVVFRQGSSLDPAALRMVGVAEARAVIITGDYSQEVEDSDAGVLRCAVLVDELAAEAGKVWEGAGARRGADRERCGPWVIAEVQGSEAVSLLHYACSDRVVPVPTSLVNARRFTRLLQHPAIATLSHSLFDYNSLSHCYIAAFPRSPHLLAQPFSQLHAFFPDAILVGIIDLTTGKCDLNPPLERRLLHGESLVMMRSAAHKERELLPHRLRHPEFDPGPGWDPHNYCRGSVDEAPLGRSSIDGGAACSWHSKRSGGAAGSTDSIDGLGRPLVPRAPLPIPANASKRRMGAAAFVPLPYAAPALGGGGATDLLICCWPGSSGMWALMQELDHGQEALPEGSRVILANDHPWEELEGSCNCRLNTLTRLKVEHVRCDPRRRAALGAAVDVAKLRAAIVLHDVAWTQSEDLEPYALSQTDMLRVDAAVLQVQLNLRYLLQDACCPDINIITEKTTHVGQTRFEDRAALPVGAAVNSASFAAKVLAHSAVEPGILNAYAHLGMQCEICVQDAGELAGVGEEVSFMQLQARCASVRQVLLGYYRLPVAEGAVLDIVVNPKGSERGTKAVWNAGDARCKLITLVTKKGNDAPLWPDVEVEVDGAAVAQQQDQGSVDEAAEAPERSGLAT